MERNPPKPMTPFDCITTPDWLYMFKLMIPYTPANIQHSLALFIRFQEMQYTMRHFHGFSKSKPSNSILNDIRPYMDPSAGNDGADGISDEYDGNDAEFPGKYS